MVLRPDISQGGWGSRYPRAPCLPIAPRTETVARPASRRARRPTAAGWTLARKMPIDLHKARPMVKYSNAKAPPTPMKKVKAFNLAPVLSSFLSLAATTPRMAKATNSAAPAKHEALIINLSVGRRL